MDVELAGPVNGLEATRRIKAVSPRSKVIIVSGHRRATLLVEAVEAGASGFMDKNEAIDDVMSAVRRAAAGEMLVDPARLAKLLPTLAAQREATRDARSRLDRLTPREREILGLVAEGCRSEAVAERLHISPPTARTHIQNILSKLGVHSQLEAVALAARCAAEPS
jgi:DNA-binding NarL/FixJ family response regulator